MLDNEPWWVAKDVCDILGLEQVSRALDRIDQDGRGLVKITHPYKAS
jgi:prophage antirepressor-like protein